MTVPVADADPAVTPVTVTVAFAEMCVSCAFVIAVQIASSCASVIGVPAETPTALTAAATAGPQADGFIAISSHLQSDDFVFDRCDFSFLRSEKSEVIQLHGS